jgi:SAP domain
MSLSNLIQSQIDNTVRQYISIVSGRYNIDKDNLLQLWFSNDKPTDSIAGNNNPLPVAQSSSSNNDDLQKLSRADLVAKCKEKGLKVSGNKTELIQRLLASTTEEPAKVTAPKTSAPVKPQTSPVLQKLSSTLPSQVISRNQFGNFEHVGSGLVFNNNSKKVYGRQNADGSISDLTSEDIELCNKFKFQYSLPDNLDKKTLDIKDEDIKELDEETEDVIDEEDVVEEEDDIDDDDDEENEGEFYYDEE